MRNKQKKEVIINFLKDMSEKDIHLVEIGRFDKDLSIWSKKSTQSSHRTLINVNVKLSRLNESDVEVEVDKFLMRGE